MPINLPQIDVLCIGAGGGSIARVDAFGALSVGPESAGAEPGPAAYGRGGEDATVTDAHVVLGTLADHSALAGRVPLDRAPAAGPWRPRGRAARARRRGGRRRDAAHRQRQHGQRAAGHVDRPRPRPAPLRARRHRRRRADARLRARRRARHPARRRAALPGRRRGARPARHRHPPRPAPQLARADRGHRRRRSSTPSSRAGGRGAACSSRRRRSPRASRSPTSSTCATAARPTT